MPRPRPDPTGPGQESVWIFPRPGVAEPTSRRLRVVFAGRVIAETVRGFRVVETSHPPSYYFPPDDVAMGVLKPVADTSVCEWKGSARYYDLLVDEARSPGAAWAYPDPTDAFRRIRNYVAFYPGRVEGCFVDGEQARSQEGGFYGGWITSHVTGPFKGSPGSRLW